MEPEKLHPQLAGENTPYTPEKETEEYVHPHNLDDELNNDVQKLYEQHNLNVTTAGEANIANPNLNRDIPIEYPPRHNTNSLEATEIKSKHNPIDFLFEPFAGIIDSVFSRNPFSKDDSYRSDVKSVNKVKEEHKDAA